MVWPFRKQSRCARSKSPTGRAAARSFRPAVETLEARDLLSITATLSGGQVVITGSDKNEEIFAFEDAGQLRIYGGVINPVTGTLNDKINEFALSKITKGIYVDAKGGNDQVEFNIGTFNHRTVTVTTKPVEIHGGKGNDHLIGGDGNDRIYGEDNNDILEGNGGNDYLDGGAGVDQMDGNTGFNTYKDDYNSRSPALGGYQYTDVSQAHSPTCQTLSSIAEAVYQGFDFSALIKPGTKANEWQVKLPGTGKTWKVTYDGTWNDNDPTPLPDSQGVHEYWVILLQRARLQSLGVSYTSPKTDADWDADQARTGKRLYDSTDALKTFTNRSTTSTDMKKVAPDAVQKALSRGDYVLFGSKDNKKKVVTSAGVVLNHAYAVLNVYKKGSTYYVDLYNPWGSDVGSDGGYKKIGPAGSLGAKADDGIITLDWTTVQTYYTSYVNAKKP